MGIALVHNVYTDEFDIIENPLTEEDYGNCGISVSESGILVYVFVNEVMFSRDFSGTISGRLTTENSDFYQIKVKLTRIVNHFKFLIEEVFATKDVKLMIRLYKYLLPLLDRMIFTQEVIDNFELPKLSPAKSARN
jgi:hypothetical protein